MDGVSPLTRVVVMAATNRPDVLDPAFIRPGRIDRLVFVPPPDERERGEIIASLTARVGGSGHREGRVGGRQGEGSEDRSGLDFDRQPKKKRRIPIAEDVLIDDLARLVRILIVTSHLSHLHSPPLCFPSPFPSSPPQSSLSYSSPPNVTNPSSSSPQTASFSDADVDVVCREASLHAVR